MKIGVCADTHIGRRIPRAIGELRREAYRHSFTQAINVFIEEDVDCLIHAGDVFEKRSMTPEDSVFVKDELQRLVDSIHEKNGKDVVMFALRGNHDGTPETNALDYIRHPLAQYLKLIGDNILQGKEEAYTQGRLRLVGIGYHPYISQRFQDIKPLVENSFRGDSDLRILAVHNFIRGYHQIPPGVPEHNMYAVSDFESIQADFIVSGHYHTKKEPSRENGKTLLTPGATEAVDLSDEGPYGVYILEEDRTARFIPIKPLHDIRNVKLTSEGAVKPTDWFVENALKEAESYASSLQTSASQGVLRIVLSGLTDGDPYAVEPALMPRFAALEQASPQLLHIELVSRLENVRQTVALPALGGGVEYAAEILEPLGEATREGMKIVEEVGNILDEKASQRTGLLTGSDRTPFVKRWTELLEAEKAST